MSYWAWHDSVMVKEKEKKGHTVSLTENPRIHAVLGNRSTVACRGGQRRKERGPGGLNVRRAAIFILLTVGMAL